MSSLRDLARFLDALSRSTLIGKAALARSFAPAALRVGVAPAMSEGGWQLDTIGGRRAAMRGGALPGVCTWMLTMPDEDVSVILLSNRTPGMTRSMHAALADLSLDHLWVVYPGPSRYEIDRKVTAVPLSEVMTLVTSLAQGRTPRALSTPSA